MSCDVKLTDLSIDHTKIYDFKYEKFNFCDPNQYGLWNGQSGVRRRHEAWQLVTAAAASDGNQAARAVMALARFAGRGQRGQPWQEEPEWWDRSQIGLSLRSRGSRGGRAQSLDTIWHKEARTESWSNISWLQWTSWKYRNGGNENCTLLLDFNISDNLRRTYYIFWVLIRFGIHWGSY